MGSSNPNISKLFKPLKVGRMDLSHRLVLAPLTRLRADDNRTHTDLAVEYYRQRSTTPGSLLITEATPVSLFAGHHANVPGIYTQAQIDAWKRVTDAVHANGSFIYVQLWGLGRTDSVLEAEKVGHDLVAPSAIAMPGGAVPRELTKKEIKTLVGDYAQAAKNAIEAGFDGVELHNANGYILDQFLQDVSNKRVDEYGGSLENRARFPLEVAKAVTGAIGPDRVGVRLSPFSTYQGMGMDSRTTHAQFSYYVNELRNQFSDLAYLHVVEARNLESEDQDLGADQKINFLEDIWNKDKERVFLRAGGFNSELAIKTTSRELEKTVVVMGRWFISNPDLPERIRRGLPLTPYDRSTFYLPKEARGYTTYPVAKDEIIYLE